MNQNGVVERDKVQVIPLRQGSQLASPCFDLVMFVISEAEGGFTLIAISILHDNR